MRSSLLVTSLVGGAVSLLAVASTHSAPLAPQAPLAAVTENAAAIAIPVKETERVPSWVLERTVDGPPVSLTASDGSGLVLAELRSSAVVEGPLAFTEMRLVFENPEDRVREGTFKVVLPQGASLGRFAMKIGGAWQEGEVVPREKARVAYEDALHRRQDPALLERGAGNEFTARVFPIPARGKKEIVVSYAQELAGGAPYALPLRGLPEVKALDISVGGEGMKTQREHHEHYTPNADFVFEGNGGPSPQALRSGNLVVARVKPVAEALAERVASAVVLVDTSASRALGLGPELRQVKEILAGIADREGDVPVSVAAFDQETFPIYAGNAKGFGEPEIRRALDRRALGASNLEKALRWAGDEAKRTGATRVILVTDAVPTAGMEDAAKLANVAASLRDGGAQRLDVVAVGGLRDDALARKLVTAGLAHDGVVVPGDERVASIVRRLEAGTRSDIAVAVEGATWSYPTYLDGAQPGDEVLVYAELPENTPLRVRVSGAPAPLAFDAVPADRPLLERAWAQAKIASLEAEERDHGKSAERTQRIVELSTHHRVLSAYTALLVLETDADYARFQIDRRALADILSVQDGALTWTKREGALPGALADKKKGEPPSDDGEREDLRRAIDAARAANAAASAEPQPLLDLLSGGGGDEREEAKAAAPPRLAAPSHHGIVQPGASGGLGGIAGSTGEGHAHAARPAPAPPPRPAPAAPPSEESLSLRSYGDAPAPPPAPTGIHLEAGTVRIPNPSPSGAPAQGGPGGGPSVAPFTGTFKLVKERLARRDVDGALGVASTWQAGSPGDVLALVALGEASEAKGDNATAARAYGSLIDLFPSRADLRRFAGERLEHMNGAAALELAIDTFDKARRDRPDHPASHRLAAFARARRGEWAAAFDILRAGLAQPYPEGRFRGVDRILREDLGLIAAAWIRAVPSQEKEILARLREVGGTVEEGPSLRFVLNWETDANDVDFHIQDALGGHAFYGAPHLPSGGDLYADVTTGYGPECFTVRLAKGARPGPYSLQAHYFSRGPMGYGMGKLEIIDHDGHGKLTFQERPFVVMTDHAFVNLGTVN